MQNRELEDNTDADLAQLGFIPGALYLDNLKSYPMKFLKNIFKPKAVITYGDFWKWFLANEKQFHTVVKGDENIHEGFFDKLAVKLDELREGFYYSAGMADDNTAELIITVEGVIKNIVFVEELILAAPVIPGWRFTALKPAVSGSTIKMGNYSYCEQNIWFYPNENRSCPDEIDITFIYADFREEDRPENYNGVCIFLDNYLGEINFLTIIDNLKIEGSANTQKELIPVTSLKAYLTWRQKESVDKFEETSYNIENESYYVLNGELKNGNKLVATINQDLLLWEGKASHPWVLSITVSYNGSRTNGMPDKATSAILEEIEGDVLKLLKNDEGYLYIGRETANNERNIYFACRDFRKPSKAADEVKKMHSRKLTLEYEIIKDKYWQSFQRFIMPGFNE